MLHAIALMLTLTARAEGMTPSADPFFSGDPRVATLLGDAALDRGEVALAYAWFWAGATVGDRAAQEHLVWLDATISPQERRRSEVYAATLVPRSARAQPQRSAFLESSPLTSR